jgi:hypothetical protein
MNNANTAALIGVCAAGLAAGPAWAGSIVIDFTGSDFSQFTPLDGTSFFADRGIGFEDGTFWASDNRLAVDFGDVYGITNHDLPGSGSNAMTIAFDQPASVATFDWVTLSGSGIEATAYGGDGDELSTFSVAGNGEQSGTHTFSGLGAIDRITFTGAASRVLIATLTYELVVIPLPAASGLAGFGLLALGARRARRAPA